MSANTIILLIVIVTCIGRQTDVKYSNLSVRVQELLSLSSLDGYHSITAVSYTHLTLPTNREV